MVSSNHRVLLLKQGYCYKLIFLYVPKCFVPLIGQQIINVFVLINKCL